MPAFYLDEQKIEFQPGDSVLRAALREGREIPHYCYHPALKVTAQCRMCLVDVVDLGNGRGLPKLQASCSTPAADGMKVESRSEKVKEGQKLVMEYLLVNHPLDCSICDQAGECDLQNFSFSYGTGLSEMEYEKRVHGWRDAGTFIVLERNRCIHCSRCERFSLDVVGTHDFASFYRSHELTFDTYGDYAITHKFQGNLADICPVGCITNRDWRFRKRAWKLQKTSSICTSCSTGCNITIEESKNTIYRLQPRENQEVNHWWMCDEGRINFRHLNDRKERILEPMARVRGELRPVSWEALYEALALRLEKLAPKKGEVLGLADSHATNEELYLFKKLLEEVWGVKTPFFPYRPGVQQESCPVENLDPFIYSLITTDKSPNTAGALNLGLIGDENDKRLKAALRKNIKVVLVLGAPFGLDEGILNSVSKADLVIHIGSAAGGWSGVADTMLPGYTFAEKWGSFTNKANRVQRVRPALRPPERCREQIVIMQELMQALGKPLEGTATAAALFNALSAEESCYREMNWEALGELGAAAPG